MPKAAILLVSLLLVALGAGAYDFLLRIVPSSSEILNKCVLREAEHPPVHRMDTCTCLAAEVATVAWTARELVMTATRRDGSREVALNACRARSFARPGNDRGPTRMSPMPKLTN